jgi:CHAT domain-containing protein
LADHRIELDEEAAIPTVMAGAELAIVAAHGGLLPGNFYFHVIANDAQLKAAARYLADAIRSVGVAVLFICSGGRVDSLASTTIGLVKYALEAGCNTVVASPWPLDARVPSYWVPAFLDAWENGRPVVDAAFEANQAVKRGFKALRDIAMKLGMGSKVTNQRSVIEELVKRNLLTREAS